MQHVEEQTETRRTDVPAELINLDAIDQLAFIRPLKLEATR